MSKRGLNENFGRELMELYSLGVDGGYTQADVIALAKLLTGWSVAAGPAQKAPVARLHAGQLQPADASAWRLQRLSLSSPTAMSRAR